MSRSSISKPSIANLQKAQLLPSGKGKALIPRHQRIAEAVGRGASMVEACRNEGIKVYANLSTDPRFQAVVAKERKKNELAIEMTRDKVMQGLLDAVDMARVMSDPHAMIKGWTEIGRMCGYYAPDTKKIEVSVSAKRLVDKFETMSDEELLKYAEKDIIDLFANEKIDSDDPNFRAAIEFGPSEAEIVPENPQNGEEKA